MSTMVATTLQVSTGRTFPLLIIMSRYRYRGYFVVVNGADVALIIVAVGVCISIGMVLVMMMMLVMIIMWLLLLLLWGGTTTSTTDASNTNNTPDTSEERMLMLLLLLLGVMKAVAQVVAFALLVAIIECVL